MIRAVKYAAATGFSLPFNLKMKIQKQSNLLAAISPSRLTEEIFKIIHSEKAAAIVNLLDKTGLYCYLQPQAAALMKKNQVFRQKYMESMTTLKGVGSLFYDYLETTSDWKQDSVENYKEIFQTARSFVLPMNPPRFEMDRAVRAFLAAKGITIKKPHIERLKSTSTVPESGETKAAAINKRRRRRRRPKPKSDVTQ
jgi:poly(A) polymerase